ncbi:MAG: isochorismate synthase, partial [Chloroflexi bacterium]|nr:isochorismate synthase [Chloroflexota bacterium]
MTIGIDDPGDLTAYLPPAGGHAWLRRGDGMVGIGEVARFEGGTADEADDWWQETCGRIEHESEHLECSGTGPIAFASFVFDPDHTEQHSVVVVPRIVIGRRNGQSWLTVVGGTDVPLPGMPDLNERPAAPVAVKEAAASLGRAQWQDIVGEAVSRISRGELDKVVLARGLTLVSETPLDPNW